MHHFVIIAVVIAVIERLDASLSSLPSIFTLECEASCVTMAREGQHGGDISSCRLSRQANISLSLKRTFTGVTPWYQQRQKSKVRDLKRGYCSKDFRKTGHAYTDLLCLSKDKAYIHLKKARKILSDSICCLFNAKPPRCDEQDIKVLARVVHKT